MKVTQMPSVHAANLVVNSDNTAYGVDVILFNWPFVRGIHRWIPLTKASDVELWCFLWYAPEHTVKQIIETLVIWEVIALIMSSL